MLSADYTKKFKKDYALAIKRGWDILLLDVLIMNLANEIPLHPKHQDHPLSGNFKGFRECHVKPDWLLIYEIDQNKSMIIINRTGTHSDLFG